MTAALALTLFLVAAESAPQSCSLPVVLLAEGNDKTFTARFWTETPRRRTVEANVRAAFRAACKKRLLAGSTIPKLGKVSTRRLYLRNAPDANVASIYALKGRMLLEYPFVGSDRSVNIPSAGEIEEAIFCAVRGATAKEQEESGRCLPD